MQLGRLGAWYSTDKLGGPKEIAAFAANVERLGYDTLWYPESRGYESFSVAGFMLGATKTLNIGSSIASIYARDAFTSRRGMIVVERAVWRPLHPGSGRQPPADGGGRSRPHLRKADPGDARLSRRHLQRPGGGGRTGRSPSPRWAR